MYIRDIKPGTAVKIFATIGTERLEFTTNAIRIEDKSLIKLCDDKIAVLTEPIIVNDKVVTLSKGNGIEYCVHAYNNEDEKMYEWHGVVPTLIQLKDGSKILMLMCAENMKPLNRRKHFRIWLGLEAAATFDLGWENYNVIIKDISSSGFALVMSGAPEAVKSGSLVRTAFYDPDTDTNFNLGGIIVRKEELEDGRVLLGCRLNSESNIIQRYISEKERINLRKHSSK